MKEDLQKDEEVHRVENVIVRIISVNERKEESRSGRVVMARPF